MMLPISLAMLQLFAKGKHHAKNPFVQKTKGFFVATQVYKPGSVMTAIYLAAQLLTRSSRLPGAVGPTYCSSTALLRIEFTS